MTGTTTGRRGRAIAEEDEDTTLWKRNSATADKNVDATVLLCGPSHVGKTRVFYRFMNSNNPKDDYPTVSSIQANVGVSSSSSSSSQSTTSTRIRWIDWPGHASVKDGALDTVVWKNTIHPVRIVVLVDATQPVASAATVLYEIWEQVVLLRSRNHRSSSSTTTTVPIPVLIACHKQDLPKAKSTKRIALQLRTALERLLTTKHPTWWPTNTSYAMDDWSTVTPYLTLYWVATSAVNDTGTKEGSSSTGGLQALQDFGFHGIVPSSS
jgi:signal recognition particle receptor subunit beta